MLPTTTIRSVCIKVGHRRWALEFAFTSFTSLALHQAPFSSTCVSRNCASFSFADDFKFGTYIINEPGTYKLCEDIEFRPNPNAKAGKIPNDDELLTLFDPDFDVYSKNGYGLGFFAAISVQSSGVTIDLNGKTLEQSPEHALMQRFFALIELASSPFIQSVGPAQFVGADEAFEPATDIVIKGPGTLGRSAHHGIHGNENSNVVITKVTFTDFEVAAVSLNNVNYLTIADCKIKQNRHDVPVVGAFSAASFIRPYLMKLKDEKYTMMLRGKEVKANEVLKDLIKSIKNVYSDVSKKGFIDKDKHPEEFHLFDNPHKVVDGPCYGFLGTFELLSVGVVKLDCIDHYLRTHKP